MRFFKILALVSMLAISSACMKEEEQNFVFTCACSATNTVSQEDFTALTEYCKAHPYFSEAHSYFGFYDEVINLAAKDFMTACNELDEDHITSYLKYGEQFTLTLVNDKSGEVILTCYFTQTEQGSESE